MNNVKICNKCKTEKLLVDFPKGKTSKDGFKNYCKACDTKNSIAYREKNLAKEKLASTVRGRKYRLTHPERKIKTREEARRYYLRTAYGLTSDDYNDMFIEQGGSCAICGTHQSELKRKLAVDHCHKTNINRGLLCDACNTALGLMKENPDIMRNMIKYLALARLVV